MTTVLKRFFFERDFSVELEFGDFRNHIISTKNSEFQNCYIAVLATVFLTEDLIEIKEMVFFDKLLTSINKSISTSDALELANNLNEEKMKYLLSEIKTNNVISYCLLFDMIMISCAYTEISSDQERVVSEFFDFLSLSREDQDLIEYLVSFVLGSNVACPEDEDIISYYLDISPILYDRWSITNSGKALKNGVWVDHGNNLMWIRFSLGQVFSNGNTCGVAKKYNWQDAKNKIFELNNSGGFFGFSDWRIPTKSEIETIINKKEEGYSVPFGFLSMPEKNNYGCFWSSSVTKIEGLVFCALFDEGVIFPGGVDNPAFVRAVRSM